MKADYHNESQNSVLQQQNSNQVKQKKQSQQIKALFLKNVRLQSKQIGTNVCQILTPIICILFAFLIKQVVQDSITIGAVFLPNNYPYNFNDYKILDKKPQLGMRSPLNWFFLQCQQNCNKTYLGSKNGLNPSSGLLGQIPNNFNSSITFKPIPYTDNNKIQSRTVPFFQELNLSKKINQELYERVSLMAKSDFDILKKQGGRDYLPDGSVTFHSLNQNELNATLQTLDARELDYYRTNGFSKIRDLRLTIFGVPADFTDFTPAVGILSLLDMISAAFLKEKTNAKMSSGYILMPDVKEGGGSFVDVILNSVSALVFPLALSLLFPVFLYSIVLQKQQKLIQMMKMNGMKISSYWLVYFIFNLILGLVTNFLFFMFGYFILKSSFFTQTSFALIFLTLFGWILAQIGLAVFFQTFLSRSRSANIVGYIVSIWTMMIGSTLNLGVYQFPTELPILLQMFPPFGFIRLFYMMLTVCSDSTCFTSINDITKQMKIQLTFLYLGFIFFFALGAYLFQIIPQQFGVTKNPLFPFTQLFRCFTSAASRKRKAQQNQIMEDEQLRKYIKQTEQDSYAKKQRENVYKTEGNLDNHALVINNLRKIYIKQGHEGDFLAVKSFNLKIREKEVFGLLGPNGAGKTTLISMITGMFQPSYGNAWIGGYDIVSNIATAQLQMGVCPQFDLLWPQLTVQQHLYFYARLKGVNSKSIKAKVQDAIKQVKLQKFRGFKSSSLSGGMKRRLSVAISLVGDPLIVFLDEPSTGLDPDNRRQLWQVLSRCAKKRSIFLTTHMMQQADTLCNRVGIITNGILRTVAPQVTLKKMYGGGYRVTMSLVKDERSLIQKERVSLKHIQGENQIEELEDNDLKKDRNLRKSVNSFVQTQKNENKIKMAKRTETLRKQMNKMFKGSQLAKVYVGSVIFKVPLIYKVSQIFEAFQTKQKQLDITDVAITNSSLEDVFMNVVLVFQEGKQVAKSPILQASASKQSISDQAFNKPAQEEQIKAPQKKQSIKGSVKQGSFASKKNRSVMSDNQNRNDDGNASD